MAVGRIKRLLVVATAAGCLGLAGGPMLAYANPGRGPVPGQGPSGKAGNGVSPPGHGSPGRAGSGSPPGLAGNGSVPAESKPGLGYGRQGGAAGNPGTGMDTGPGGSATDSGEVTQGPPLNIPEHEGAAEPVESAGLAESATAGPYQVPQTEPLGFAGTETALGTVLVAGSCVVGPATPVPPAVNGPAAFGSAGVGAPVPLLLLLLPVAPVLPPAAGPQWGFPAPEIRGSVEGTGVSASGPLASDTPGGAVLDPSAPSASTASPSYVARQPGPAELLSLPELLSVLGGIVALALAGGASAVLSYRSAAQAQARIEAVRAEFFGPAT